MSESTTSVTVDKGHGLLCPACRVDLVMSERQGIEIDYCPKCRGVWLDRGELDKIIERSEESAAAPPQRGAPPPYPDRDRHDRGYESGHHRGHGYKRKHESFLSRLFD